MVNEKTKNTIILTPDGTRRSSSLETMHHRGRKRSLSSSSTSGKGLLHQQSVTKEESDASRLLSKHGTQKLLTSNRQGESARLLKLIPELSQKEMSRLVGAIIKRQKRETSSVGRRPVAATRDRTLPSSAPPLFPDKSPETIRSQMHKVEMPARSTASTRHEAIQMLRESKTEADRAVFPDLRPSTSSRDRSHLHRDLAEELIYLTSPR